MKDYGRLHNEIVKKVGEASEKWGFFQVVNDGISSNTLEAMIEGVRGFHGHDDEVKKSDSMYCSMLPTPPNPQKLPQLNHQVQKSVCHMVLAKKIGPRISCGSY
ncbi:hypothetical protein FEM48_Zijuj07G0106000 [Ziziphus jujuba var. spinosa]|uniref:Non-haem dioxygenase N-terminal domain-containing protein n=1 Tax=Ziziphus jujuba var. spinosa TaxID=714518 RepID=A0A978V451_ZIZJJ|nr:hypothetical protein FEM48_Zijuj07G0106000 [Ziziphus jujuba var. spinosa]